jgi:hypothetical protein
LHTFCAYYRFFFQARQARRRCNKLLTGALVNQFILRLIKCPDYPQPPKRGTPATLHFTRMTLIRPPCSSHRFAAGYSDSRALRSQSAIQSNTFTRSKIIQNQSVCSHQACQRDRVLLSKHWRYDTTGLMSHASMLSELHLTRLCRTEPVAPAFPCADLVGAASRRRVLRLCGWQPFIRSQ